MPNLLRHKAHCQLLILSGLMRVSNEICSSQIWLSLDSLEHTSGIHFREGNSLERNSILTFVWVGKFHGLFYIIQCCFFDKDDRKWSTKFVDFLGKFCTIKLVHWCQHVFLYHVFVSWELIAQLVKKKKRIRISLLSNYF